MSYRELGHPDSALAAFARAKPLANGQPLAGLAVLYARLGRKREATAIARDLEEWYRSHYYAPEYIAAAWANIGDTDRRSLAREGLRGPLVPVAGVRRRA